MSPVGRPSRREGIPKDRHLAPTGRLRLPDDVEESDRTEHHQADRDYRRDLEYGTPEENCDDRADHDECGHACSSWGMR